jgi:tripartite-type tricarboxylate transporter receptor subunit TctC
MSKSMKLAYSAALLLLPVLSSAKAADIESFYRSHPISLVIGYSAGSAYDVAGRLLGRHIAEHIPGKPSLVPTNMPGAGSLKAANFLYGVAPRDGSTIGTFSRGLAVEPLIGVSDAQFDATRFTWLGSMADEVSVCAFWHTSPIATWNDMLTKKFIAGANSYSSDTGIFMLTIAGVFGTNVKMITGYPGGNELAIAMERGEIDGRCGWSWSAVQSSKPDWLSSDKIKIPVQLALQKNPSLKDVPLITELTTDERKLQILRLVFSRQQMAWPFVAPPDIPIERKQALQAAFDATMKDQKFQIEAKKMLAVDVNPMSGTEVDALLRSIYNTPREIINETKAMLSEQKSSP